VLAATGICGLPPFCGFAGELLIYVAAFSGIAQAKGVFFGASMLAVLCLALTGGVACAALAKAVGGAFLGEPRSDYARQALPEKSSMVLPQVLLTTLALLLPLAYGVLPCMEWFETVDCGDVIASAFQKNSIFLLVFYGVVGAILLLRRRAGKDDRAVGTWDCGYARPTSRMEYTGSALVQPLADQFGGVLGLERQKKSPQGLFPTSASLVVTDRDLGRRVWWNPLFRGFSALSERIHRFQSGYLHVYMLIMVLALALMLAWAFFA